MPVTIHVDHGRISIFNLNVSMAYDYRIVSDDAVFENSNAQLGLISKGGGGYFLSRQLGVRKATEVLQWSDFSAEEALHMGLVDRIVPKKDLEGAALEMARSQNAKNTATLLGLRKLLKCDLKELQRNLELEDQLIMKRISAPDFKRTFVSHCQSKGLTLAE